MACATAASHAQAPAHAQAPPSVPLPVPTAFDPATLDPSVSLVVSGGQWDTGAERGTFRLLLLRGWSRPGGRVVVQWLEVQPTAKALVLHSSREVDAIQEGRWVLGIPRLEKRNAHWYVVITGTTDAGRIRRTWRFALDAPGKLREVQLP